MIIPLQAVTVSSAEEVIQHADDPHRQLPLVIISSTRSTGEPGIPVETVIEDLAGGAIVLVLPPTTRSWGLIERKDLNTYGGAVRVLGPAGHSTIIRTDRTSSEVTLARIHRAVELAQGHGQAGPSTAPESDKDAVATAETARLRAEVTRLQGSVRDLRSQIRRLEDQLTQAQRHERPQLFADPQQQLHYEIEQTWLRQTAEIDRPVHPLRPYTLGEHFLESLQTVAAPRDRVLTILVDVLTRRAWTIPARGVHTHNAGPTGNPITRADGGMAYRCSIKDHTPGAPRLLWWEQTDGTVEFARVGHHDSSLPGASK